MQPSASLFSPRHWLRAPVRRVLTRQLYFTGAESVLLVMLIGIALGAIIVAQLHYTFGQSGADTLRLLAQLLFSELAPLVTALILIARSSSAMASELAAMQVHREIRVLRQFGVSPVHYLVVPRVGGMVLASVFLALYLALAALLTAALMTAGPNAWDELLQLGDVLPLQRVLGGLTKTALFGSVIALIACRAGFLAGSAVTDIPQAASQAVVRSLITVFVLDALWGLL
ncbi:MAG: ABC transporter permease [Moraxellaceae bacterium]|nr:ABC transporter permease [Moraxellaceae bacterium]